MNWKRLLGGIATGGLSEVLPAVGGVVKEIAEAKREERRTVRELKKQRMELDREIVRRTTNWTRMAVLAYLFGPDVALLIPWIEAADLSAYYTAIAESEPQWRQDAKQYIVFAMWGGAEAVNLGHAAMRQRKRDKTAAPPAEPDPTRGRP